MKDFIIASWDFTQSTPSPNQDDSPQLKPGIWFHCQRDHPDLPAWLTSLQIPVPLVHTLLANDTRPRFEKIDEDVFLIIVRGINLNQDAKPDDMLSLRFLWYKGMLISTRKVSSRAVSMVLDLLKAGSGPKTLPAILSTLLLEVHQLIANFLDPIEDTIDELDVLNIGNAKKEAENLNHNLHRLQRIRRYLKPQQYALQDLLNAKLPCLHEQRLIMKNCNDVAQRTLESVEFYIEQINGFFIALSQHQSERMNKNTYLFSVVAGIFLPAGFLTGLLGVNIAGMPGTENPYAFLWFTLGLMGTIALEVLVLRMLKFI
ncbi:MULTISPECIES: CorA family divalent cation transporter [Photobacterium]|uniref:Magnesium transporter n=1 Tax=Photobacterium ganghwense TaxID=320778 RepID=A0A0J1H921_9GAMM|nr:MULTISPECIES: CorA family divalent cation transporter [Photobacterium]KLV08180.1 magnesium transporter [Photobacterium ganghwense]MBV1839849.1 zinc transporter ZntB [Photobacterium ganghwense]PSU07308.1 zinc transporter ZntB [Photobacterium ganghwense]QSV16041.1 zinc transporter ZntB [Photobacterium ganghwense]